MGWPRAWEQHDIAEFHDFLIPRLLRATGDTWQGRVMTEDGAGTRVNHTSLLNRCLSLPLPPVPKLDIQELVNGWHQQDDLCAIVGNPAWLCLQLPRFDMHSGAKTHHPYVVPGTLDMPVFADAASQAVVWRSYKVHSIIRHHGATFCAGHYTVMVRGSSDFILDDASPPKQVVPRDLDDTSQSMYLIILCADAALSTFSRDLSSADAQVQQHGLHGSDSVHREGEIPVSATLSAGDLDKAVGERSRCPTGAYGHARPPNALHSAPLTNGDHNRRPEQGYS